MQLRVSLEQVERQSPAVKDAESSSSIKHYSNIEPSPMTARNPTGPDVAVQVCACHLFCFASPQVVHVMFCDMQELSLLLKQLKKDIPESTTAAKEPIFPYIG